MLALIGVACPMTVYICFIDMHRSGCKNVIGTLDMGVLRNIGRLLPMKADKEDWFPLFYLCFLHHMV